MDHPSAPSPWPLPPSERTRLSELRALDILHTPPEDPYDGLVEIAAALFETPMALVSLIDAEKQWFKARIGIDVCGTGREVAFCAHAIMGARPLVVEDANLDLRFRDNPLVVGEPFIRFYAGAPIVTDRGEAIGTLCVIDTRPRSFPPERLRLLERLARQAGRLMEARRLQNEVAALFSGRP